MSNDYTSIRELNQRSPASFGAYFVEMVRSAADLLFPPSYIAAPPRSSGRTAMDEFPPLSKPTGGRLGQQATVATVSRDALDTIDTLVEIYSAVLFNRLYGASTLIAEMAFLMRVLALVHRADITPSSTMPRPLLFPSAPWAMHFVLRTLHLVYPLLATLHPKLLSTLADNITITTHDKDLAKKLADASSRSLEQHADTVTTKKATRIATPFRSMGDADLAHKKLRKSEDAQLYNNREKCLDAFYELMRLFQVDPKSLHPAQPHSAPSFAAKTRDFFFMLNRANLWWFCELFIDTFLQCRLDDSPLETTPWAATPGTPDKITLLQRRLEQKPSTPAPIISEAAKRRMLPPAQSSPSRPPSMPIIPPPPVPSSRLLSFFTPKEQFFISFALHHDSHQFFHHLTASIVDKIAMMQTCTCSAPNHGHADFYERLVLLRSLFRLLGFAHYAPTDCYANTSTLALQSPSFSEIVTRTHALPPPIDLRALLISAVTSETLALAVPCVIEFARMADSVAREGPALAETINLLKNLYNLPALLPTPNSSSFTYSTLSILLELEAFFEASNSPAHQFTHVSLPISPPLATTSGTPPTPSKTPATPSKAPATPSKGSTTPSKTSTPASTGPTSPAPKKPNNALAVDTNSQAGYTLLWAYAPGGTPYLDPLFAALAEAASTADPVATTSPTKGPKKRIVPTKKIAPISNPSSDASTNPASPVQTQLEWWFFWNHPGIARISNLLTETLLPLFTEMVFNLAVPIVVRLANTHLDDVRASPSKSPAPANHAGSPSKSPAPGSESALVDNHKLQELITAVQSRLRAEAGAKVAAYCRENVRTLLLMLLPSALDDDVLCVATSIVARYLQARAHSVCVPNVLQKARVLAIEIVARKQALPLTKTSLQLLNISLADVANSNRAGLTVSAVTGAHLARVDGAADLRALCSALDRQRDLLAPILASIRDTESAAQIDRAKLASEVAIILVQAEDLLDREMDEKLIRTALPILFKLVLGVLSDVLIVDNCLAGEHSLDLQDSTTDKSKGEDDGNPQPSFQVDLQPQRMYILPVNEGAAFSNAILRHFTTLIKRMASMNADFIQLVPHHLLSVDRIFSIASQSLDGHPSDDTTTANTTITPPSDQFKLLLIGDSSVGKTSLLLRFAENTFQETSVNMTSLDYKVKNVTIDGKTFSLQIVNIS
eukprot:gene5647-6517_t